MIQAGAMLVESVTGGMRVGMQAEQLPSTEREHGVVKAPACSSSSRTGSAASSPLYQRVLRSRSVTVTAKWAIGGNSGHSSLLVDGGNVGMVTAVLSRLLTAEAPAYGPQCLLGSS